MLAILHACAIVTVTSTVADDTIYVYKENFTQYNGLPLFCKLTWVTQRVKKPHSLYEIYVHAPCHVQRFMAYRRHMSSPS